MQCNTYLLLIKYLHTYLLLLCAEVRQLQSDE